MSEWNVEEYDYYRDHLDRNREFWEFLRAAAPVARVHGYGGYYLVSRYSDVDAIFRDPARYSSRYGTAISAGPNLEELANPMIPIDSDPPDTGKYRRLVAGAMSPANMEARSEEARALADELLDAVEADRFDYVAAFADPFPREVTMRAIGFDIGDLRKVRPWLTVQANVPRDDERFEQARAAGDEFLRHVIEERRESGPREDLISCVVFGAIDGEPPSDKVAASLLKNLLMGALGTTTKTLTEAVYAFATQPHLADKLRADPSLWVTAVDEILRYTSVIHGYGRTVTTETELGGCRMHRGDRVRPLLASANRDPAAFDRPDEVVLERSPNRHLAFGQGAHKCIGQHLAKVMIRVGLSALLERYQTIELDHEVPINYYAMESASAMGNLPLRVVRAS